MSFRRPQPGAARKRSGRGVILFEDDPFPIGSLDRLLHRYKDQGRLPYYKKQSGLLPNSKKLRNR